MAGVADTTTEYRLKRSIDAFPASDGSLYLLRTGAGEDYVVEDATARDRVILELLGKGYVSEAAIVAASTGCAVRNSASSS